ncbi:MAG: ISL3 family transposase [Bacteroidota bacterium]
MDSRLLFTQALGLSLPWRISELQFSSLPEEPNTPILEIWIDHPKGAKFSYEGAEYSVYDHQPRKWRHLNFFQHTCYLYCNVPRIQTSDGHTLLVEVPWARPGSSFTLLFEAYSLLLVESGMNYSAAGKLLGLDSRCVSRMLTHYVEAALDQTPLASIEQVGLDETSVQKGHKYVTVLSDPVEKRVVGLSVGKDTKAAHTAIEQMKSRGADPSKVNLASIDLSKAYIRACKDYLPKAKIVFDRFHLQKLLNQAVDQVRREDQKHNQALKRSRYLWLRNGEDLHEEKRKTLLYLQQLCPRIGQAYRLKEQFREIWNGTTAQQAISQLIVWIKLAQQSLISPIQSFVKTLQNHWYGITTYFQTRQTNAYAERVNLTIQEIKRTARGFRNMDNFFCLIYFRLGKLNLNLPTING